MYNYPKKISTIAFLKYLSSPKMNILSFMDNNLKELGDTFCLQFPFNQDKFIVSKNPELAEYILKKNQINYNKSYLSSEGMGLYLGNSINLRNGEDWKRQRKLMQPAFTKKSIADLVDLMTEEIYSFMKTVPLNVEVDIYDLMHQLVFKIILRSLFGTDYDVQQLNSINKLIVDAQEMCSKEIQHPYLKWWYILSKKRDRTLNKIEKIRKIINDIIQKRLNLDEPKGDILSMLMNAKYEDNGKNMPREDLINEVLFLIIAGHETTANAMSWSISLLSHDREEMEKLIKECEDLGNKMLDWECLIKPSHTSNVINESMRLYPPIWILDRAAVNEDSFGEFSWKSNTTFILYVYGMQHDDKFWENPHDFIPDRFNDPESKRKPFYPFGGGPRMCIGNHFSLVEMNLILRILYHDYEVELTHELPLADPIITLRPNKVHGKFIKK